jgi:N utilization substance protein B
VRRTDQRRAAVFALYQSDVTGNTPAEQLDEDATAFTRELADGTAAHKPDLDELIGRYARGWSLDRIAPLERNILRVALYELLHRPDVPAEVAIDEAVEAAKELCATETPGFVNGVLGAIQRQRVAAQ